MKKTILLFAFAFGFNTIANAQINFGIKGGLNHTFNSIKNLKGSSLENFTKGYTGYHGGVWVRVKIPVIGFYVRPELVYTSFSNRFHFRSKNKSVPGTYMITGENQYIKRIDIPILFGKRFLKIANLYLGPSFQYILNSDVSFKEVLTEVKIKNFSVGLQFGGGIEIGKFGLDIRWEQALSSVQSTFIQKAIGEETKFDSKTSQIIMGLTYKIF